jgi:hypothetical protein
VRSWWGENAFDHVVPSSREVAINVSYASVARSTALYQNATSDPSRRRITPGGSTPLTNQSVPLVTVRGGVH